MAVKPDDAIEGELRRAIAAHDARVREAGLELWLGAEPTFTDPKSSDPEWIGAAVGGTKETRALALWVALHLRTAPVARRTTERPRAGDPRAADARVADSRSMGQSSMGPSSMGPSSMGQSSMGPSSMGPSSMGQSSMGQSSMGPSSMGQSSMEPRSIDLKTTDPRATELKSDSSVEMMHQSGPSSALTNGRRQLALRTLGRQYPGESAPRFSLGLYARRDGNPLCAATFEDPAFTPHGTSLHAPRARELRDALASTLGGTAFETDGALPHRLVVGTDPRDARCLRPALEGRAIPESGLVDELAEDGMVLVCVGVERTPIGPCVVLELPGFAQVEPFLAFLESLGEACRTSQTRTLILRGFPPPVDARIRFATLTPDPGVVEVNMAPCTELSEFAVQVHAIHDAAHEVGLAAERRHYNGEVSDSGGGGHLTFGGPSTDASPFFRFPMLLPKLVAYLNQHPSLSYYFGGHAVGSASQSPRADESARELFGELQLALDRLVRPRVVASPKSKGSVAGAAAAPVPARVDPALLWSSLAPFLADRFGNTHRSEINVEKLFNPWLPGRGKLGVIELRAFRQAPTSAHAIARAALFRAILARLATRDFPIVLRDFGAELHDRYTLPFFLEGDLREVLGDLERAGFGLPNAITYELFRDPHRVLGEVELGDPKAPVTLTVRRALEHWPLVGDLSQQAGTTRLVDPSTTRLEVRVTGPSERVGRVSVGVRDGGSTFRAPTTFVDDGARSAVVVGVRFRAFVPSLGLHPSLPARDPLQLVVTVGDRAYALSLHAWIPNGGVYPGLPEGDEDATRRRLGRFVVAEREAPSWSNAPSGATTRHTIDARWL